MADNFTVVDIRRGINLTPGSDRKPSYEVRFTTLPHHIEGAVTISADELTPDEVTRVAGEAATNLEAVWEV